MKRMIAAFAALLMLTLTLAGCGAAYKDGTYRAEAAEYSHGWKDYVVVTVAGGKVTVDEFDSVNETGDKKSLDPSYREAMEPVSGTYPEKFIPEIVAEYAAKGSVDKMDNITGATNSTNSFKTLVTAALGNAKSGVTETAVVSTAG